ncbi:MAG: HAMP domain-containing histidine kinase [Candidatus Thiodiazotropha taylori]|nr:HAMP domain-containing histidine kinase [Candidatus Thiodiazotropha endolucinida]MCW4229189.1 HAMP domain-containing histidine kinase [Candidatus Thiodiazotropha taylori]
MIELLKSISGYISVPLLLIFGWVIFHIWRRIELLKNEQIKFGQELVKLKNEEIQILERHIGVLRDERIDPNGLLASVEIIEKATKKELEEMRKEYEEALSMAEEEKEKRQHLEEAYSKFNSILEQDNSIVKIISHELSSYAVGIRATASRLNSNSEMFLSNPDRARFYLADIEEHADSLLSFIGGISSLSQKNIESLRLKEISPLKDIVLPVINGLSTVTKKSDAKISIDYPEKIKSLKFNADKSVLSRAFQNVLYNALQFSEKDSSVTVRLEANNDNLMIHVTNYGLPIQDQDKDRIFEPYYRSPNAIRQSARGMGLGLYVARKALELHGGSISLTKTGSPTEFSLKLPLQGKLADD